MGETSVRLFVDHALAEGERIALTRDQAHYLFGVMRLGPGDTVEVFDGRTDGRRAEVVEAGKKAGVLVCGAVATPFRAPPDLWLMFAPIRKERTDFIVEKAAEMGAARILPVQTEHTNAGRVKRERLQAHAVEAAEQCGGTFVPEVAEMAPLGALLDGWDAGRRILWPDEALAGPASTLSGAEAGPWAILVGPEGGFSDGERARLRGMACVTPVSLGPRILRADTAAVAALTLWQAALGDWR